MGKWVVWAEILLGGTGVIVLLLSCNSLPFGHYVDDMKWVLLAESFLRGSTQTAWSALPLPDTSITWGFSLLLTPVVALFGRHEIVFKVYSALCLIIGSGFFYLSIRRMLDVGGRALVLVGLGGVTFWGTFSGNVISEAGYLLLFGLFLYLLKNPHFYAAKSSFFLGIVSGALTIVRSIGGLVSCSMVIFGRRFVMSRSFLFFVAGFLFVAGPITIIIHHLSGAISFYGPYWSLGEGAGFPVFAGRFITNIHYYWKGLTCMTLVNLPAVMGPNPWVKLFFMLLGAVGVLRGIWVWKDNSLGRWLTFYFLGNLVILGLWTYQAPRYALPVYPVFLAFLGAGVTGGIGRVGGRIILGSFLFAVLFTNGPELGGLIRKSFSQGTIFPHRSEDWLGEHSHPNDVIVSMDVARVYYHTGLRGLPFIPSIDLDSFRQGARQLGAQWFFFRENDFVPTVPGLTDPIAQQRDMLRTYLFESNSFDVVYRNSEEKTTIFRFRDGEPS
jgi:hypothetical protein